MQSIQGTDAHLQSTGTERDIISGECQTAALQITDAAGIRCGLWSCTPGVWRSSWGNWEHFTVLAGAGTLIDQDGTTHELAPGAVVFIPAGSTGIWNVTEAILKSYVAPSRSQ